jgi:hypothetical protein
MTDESEPNEPTVGDVPAPAPPIAPPIPPAAASRRGLKVAALAVATGVFGVVLGAGGAVLLDRDGDGDRRDPYVMTSEMHDRFDDDGGPGGRGMPDGMHRGR